MVRWLRRLGLLRIASGIGALALLELLMETWAGFFSMTTGSPLAFLGVLIELPGSIWFLVLVGLESALAAAHPQQQHRLNTYVFAWSILGLAAAVFAFMNADQSARGNWQYRTAAACVCVVFVVAGMRRLGSPLALYRSVVIDLRHLLTRGTTWMLSGAAAALIIFGPNGADVPSRREPPLRGQALIDWFDAQPRTLLPAQYVRTPLVVATFIDYQCPACLNGELLLRPLFDDLAQKFAGVISFVRLDLPLESECNNDPATPNLHPAACEAAAVLRIARMEGDSRSVQVVERWIWANQSTMTRATVFQKLREELGVFDVERRYTAVAEAVRAEAAIGSGLGIRATPRYWINGVVTPPRYLEDMRTLILHELQRLGHGPTPITQVTGVARTRRP